MLRLEFCVYLLYEAQLEFREVFNEITWELLRLAVVLFVNKKGKCRPLPPPESSVSDTRKHFDNGTFQLQS